MRSGNQNDNEGSKTRKRKEMMDFGWYRGNVTPVVCLARVFCGFSGKFNMTSWTGFDNRRYVLKHLFCIGCPNIYLFQASTQNSRAIYLSWSVRLLLPFFWIQSYEFHKVIKKEKYCKFGFLHISSHLIVQIKQKSQNGNIMPCFMD